MQFDDVLLGRRSIRGYKSDPVPKSLIKEVLALAMRSPSSMNTQPWNFTIVTGKTLDLIRAGNTERNLAGVPHSREFRIGQPFAGQHRDRQVGVAKQCLPYVWDMPLGGKLVEQRAIACEKLDGTYEIIPSYTMD